MAEKILQINTVVNSGSTGRIAEQIGESALAQGWESWIAHGRGRNKSRSRLIRIGGALDIAGHGFQTRLLDRHGLGSEKATLALVEKIKTLAPSVIHLHNIHGYYLNIKVLFEYLAGAGIPVAWTLHDCWPVTGHCIYFEAVACRKWQTGCHHCPQKRTYPASWLLDRSRANFQLKKKLFTAVPGMVLVPVSRWLAGIISKSFLAGLPVSVIHNGVDTAIFRPETSGNTRRRYNPGNHFIILGAAGQWSRRKGLDVFLQLARSIDDNTRILLAGLDRKQRRSLPANIIGLPRIESPGEMAALYSAADLFINPTREDTFPTTNLEAMACGTPVLTWRAGGSAEAVTGKTGFVIEKDDIRGITRAIAEVRRKTRAHYSAECVRHARNHFGRDRFTLEYIRLYERMIRSADKS